MPYTLGIRFRVLGFRGHHGTKTSATIQKKKNAPNGTLVTLKLCFGTLKRFYFLDPGVLGLGIGMRAVQVHQKLLMLNLALE